LVRENLKKSKKIKPAKLLNLYKSDKLNTKPDLQNTGCPRETSLCLKKVYWYSKAKVRTTRGPSEIFVGSVPKFFTSSLYFKTEQFKKSKTFKNFSTNKKH
jgi:hypothetical protein